MPTIQDQLDELKATVELILAGIKALEHQLDGGCTEREGCECDNCTTARADFDAWADAFNHRWEGRKQGVGCCVADDATYKPCGPLCTEHGDARDTSVSR